MHQVGSVGRRRKFAASVSRFLEQLCLFAEALEPEESNAFVCWSMMMCAPPRMSSCPKCLDRLATNIAWEIEEPGEWQDECPQLVQNWQLGKF
jgi:hypothetical protein